MGLFGSKELRLSDEWANRWIFVTGCDTGFGNVLCRMLSEKGIKVFAGCFAEASIKRLQDECPNVVGLTLDVTNGESIERAAELMAERLKSSGGVLYGLVNNAGVLLTPGPTEWQPVEAYRKMFEVNVYGVAGVTKACLPLLRQSKGRIVNVASIAGRMGLPGSAAYCASKYAVEGYSEVLRRDVQHWGITVHVIEPGIFKATSLFQTVSAGYDSMWNNLKPEVRDAYGEAYCKTMKHKLTSGVDRRGSTQTEMVPQAMMHALTAPKPHHRYRVGKDSQYDVTLITWLCERTQDRLLSLMSEEDGTKMVWPAHAPPKAEKTALARYASKSSAIMVYPSCLVVGFGAGWLACRLLRPRL